MNQLYTARFDEVRNPKNFKEFYALAKLVNPELSQEQFRATTDGGSAGNWPYSGTKLCKVCRNSINTPYFYQEGVTPAAYWQEGGQTPKHDCIKAHRDPETGELMNETGMPVSQQEITLDPIIP